MCRIFFSATYNRKPSSETKQSSDDRYDIWDSQTEEDASNTPADTTYYIIPGSNAWKDSINGIR